MSDSSKETKDVMVRSVMGRGPPTGTEVTPFTPRGGVRMPMSHMKQYTLKLKQVTPHYIVYVDWDGNISTAGIDGFWHVQIQATFTCNLGPLEPGQSVVVNMESLHKRMKSASEGYVVMRIVDSTLTIDCGPISIVQTSGSGSVNLMPLRPRDLAWSAVLMPREGEDARNTVKAFGEEGLIGLRIGETGVTLEKSVGEESNRAVLPCMTVMRNPDAGESVDEVFQANWLHNCIAPLVGEPLVLSLSMPGRTQREEILSLLYIDYKTEGEFRATMCMKPGPCDSRPIVTFKRRTLESDASRPSKVPRIQMAPKERK